MKNLISTLARECFDYSLSQDAMEHVIEREANPATSTIVVSTIANASVKESMALAHAVADLYERARAVRAGVFLLSVETEVFRLAEHATAQESIQQWRGQVTEGFRGAGLSYDLQLTASLLDDDLVFEYRVASQRGRVHMRSEEVEAWLKVQPLPSPWNSQWGAAT